MQHQGTLSSNVASYLERRRLQHAAEMSRGRDLCRACLQPPFGCYCADLRPFDPKMRFVVLIHPLEARRRIATGRMSHLNLIGSRLIRGEDFSNDLAVDAIVRDPALYPVVLYPGPGSVDLSKQTAVERATIFPADKTPAVIVLDGTWWTARKMIRSSNLKSLPRICFTPAVPSRFRVRKQPKPECWSTIEAIHETIELLGESRGFDTASRRHDSLLRVFDVMVERQLKCVHKIRCRRHASPLRRPKPESETASEIAAVR
jgi:DTW domain-containing protein YfiP